MIGIQRKRVKGWRMPGNCVCVTRPGRYGNPYKAGDRTNSGHLITKEVACYLYEQNLREKYSYDELREFLRPLLGKDLACFCPMGDVCHRDVLIRIVKEIFG